ncbi:MAG: hypothetical protein JXB10_00545 [Pirellulales bacterium]|nr:hypothetical protein [Pirellulales bacterium]
MSRALRIVLPAILLLVFCRYTLADSPEAVKPKSGKQYFAHQAVEDRYGVIAPWYGGLNGQCDFRVRVAAETLKRYPWIDRPAAITPGPCYVFDGHWQISPEGGITTNTGLNDWDNGDLGQRSAYVLTSLANYYRYAGDPAALGPMTINADYLLDYCQTPATHDWPGFLISCPTRGKAYGRADPKGFIQLDYACQVGLALADVYRLTGEKRYLDAVNRWADLLARHCDHAPGAAPWGRYANPEDARRLCPDWKDQRMTGGVVLVLLFLDEVIRLGHRGADDAVVKARDAGERYLRDALLPRWMDDSTWGRHFWDWENPVCTVILPCFAAQYFMDRPDRFPNWRRDCRNIISLFIARATVDANSSGGPYSGAWALPESSACCGLSLQYPTQALAAFLLRYGQKADSPWADELGRRMILLSTYDVHENGVVEDLIHGGAFVSKSWFNLAHPWPLKYTLDCMAWRPDLFGAGRENHVMRSSSVVTSVVYGKGRIEYETFADPGPSVDVLRLAFVPRSVTADGAALSAGAAPDRNGYTIRPLENGDSIVTIRHDGRTRIVVEGDDPQQMAGDDDLHYTGGWDVVEDAAAYDGKLHAAAAPHSEATFAFEGNQVRLIGRADPNGGKADVYLDGIKQPAGLDCWCPMTRDRQVLYYKNGLPQGKHTLKVVVLGRRNPVAKGDSVYLDGLQWSAATGAAGFGSGGGPAGPQRIIFGYMKRSDYVDSQKHIWRPATEVVMRLAWQADLVPIALWTEPRAGEIAGTEDPELYRYGIHGNDFVVHFTVSPSATYHVRIKFAEARTDDRPGQFATSIAIQGEDVVKDMDVAATAGGYDRAVDLVFNDVQPRNGLITIRFYNPHGQSAIAQAVEIGPGRATGGAKPVVFQRPLKEPAEKK